MEFEQPEVLWRYTDIPICHLKHVEVGWSTLKYPHTDHCHKHVRYHDGVTLYFSMKFPSVAPKKTGNWYFSFSAFWRKNNQKKKRGKPWLNARKHWESKSINRNLSAAVLQVKPSCNQINLNDIGISLQRADTGSYHFLVTGTKIFQIIWKLSENCLKICIRYDEERLITAAVLSSQSMFPSMSW